MSLKHNTQRCTEVHVFGMPNITSCSYEEYNKIFNNEFDISNLNYKNFERLLNGEKDKELDSFLGRLKNNYSDIYYKLIKCISITLLMSTKPTLCFALVSNGARTGNFLKDILEQLGSDIFDGISGGAIKGILIVTALRLLVEYSRGGSKYKFFDITKQCIIVLLMIIVLPTLPGIVTLFVNKYLTY